MVESDLSRRTVLKGAAAGSIALAAATATSSGLVGIGPARSAPAQNRVVVVGGGVAGLTTAHELAERGFKVTVFEKRAWGGKARSMDSALPVADGRRPLPGEHGFRFFPGYYQAVPDTMKRIPFPGNANGVYDNLTSAPTLTAAQSGADITLPFGIQPDQIGAAIDLKWIIKTLAGAAQWIPKLPYSDLLTFANRLFVYFTSCDARRIGQWEQTSFLDFAKVTPNSNPQYMLLISTLTRTLVAAKEEIASSRTMCTQAENFLLNILNRNNDGRETDNLLNGPTNERWIDPWMNYLKSQNVDFQLGFTIQSLNMEGGKIKSATVQDQNGATSTIEADWFVTAVAPEQVSNICTPDIYNADPGLAKIKDLFVDWMTGIQFFVNTDKQLAPGHIGWIESPWRLTGIQQGQHWKPYNISRDFGDGKAKEILSVDISDWHTPGELIKKAAKDCSPEEVARESWHQVTKTLDTVKESDLVYWHLDPGIKWDGSANTNDDPLMINTAKSWGNRPTSVTKIPNLFLAGDFCQSNIDLATMEGACEGGRNAANAILDASGSTASKAKLWPHVTISEFDGLRALDETRWRNGQKNLFDN
ncbi:hydroxysqualene dehydroxylase [Nocardia vinacea]|uniref:hydroxysqualene dehydroxylase n=1 Tax=Nocardia vinacea TaxID=96468 RepID=UPI0002FAFD9C|nr:FAD-dependent oxidoreductase [Nocardia vinacea]